MVEHEKLFLINYSKCFKVWQIWLVSQIDMLGWQRGLGGVSILTKRSTSDSVKNVACGPQHRVSALRYNEHPFCALHSTGHSAT